MKLKLVSLTLCFGLSLFVVASSGQAQTDLFSKAKGLLGKLIPTVIDQNPCAHLRMPRDMIFHGWSMRLFQAWQHSATMSS